MRKLASFVLLYLVTISAVAQVTSRYNEEAEKIFQEGITRFRSGDFESAYSNFSSLLSAFPNNPRVTAAYVMGAKALYRLKRFESSIQLLKEFLRSYPSSRYISDAHFTLATNYYALGYFEDALKEFLQVLDQTKERDLFEKSEHFVDLLCSKYVDEGTLKRHFERASVPVTKVLLGLKLAEKWMAEGKANEARSVLSSLLQLYPNSVYAGRVRELLGRFDRVAPIKIGVVLPLFTQSSDPGAGVIGKEMRQGIEFAAEEFRAEGVNVVLTILDSEGNPEMAASAVRSLAMDKEVVAILGPVYSEEVAASAREANNNGVPLVTPTATSIGLASTGSYIFQANPDYATRGKAMARYAMERLGFRTFAVLAPIDSYGKFMAESFVQEIRRRGGKIIGIEWYQKGTTEFREQLMRLRWAGRLEQAPAVVSFARKIPAEELKKLLDYGVSRVLLDSLIARRQKISVKLLFGSNGERVADSLQIPMIKDLPEEDFLEIPVHTIDAFYLPIASAEEIGIISAQLAYHNFKTQLLGSGDWYNLVELDANRQYTNGVIFDSDTYADPADSNYIRFFDRFYQKTKMRPTKNTLFGYDTARLILSAAVRSVSSSQLGIGNDIVTREDLASALRRIDRFHGLRSIVSFNRGRVNVALNILQYKSGEVKKLDDMILQEE